MKNSITIFILLFSFHFFSTNTFAQSTGVKANFGIRGAMKSGVDSSAMDDWAQGTTGTGVINNDGTPNSAYKWTAHVKDAAGSGDYGFSGNYSVQSNPRTWVLGSSSILDKSNLTNVYAHARRDAGDSLWLFLAADRYGVNGTTTLAFEFLRKGITLSGTSITALGADSGRTAGVVSTPVTNSGGTITTPGDILVSVDWSGSSVTTSVYMWCRDPGNGITWNAESGYSFGWALINPPSGAFVSAINTTSIAGGAWGAPQKNQSDTLTLVAGAFAEVGLNLVKFGIDNVSNCANILQAIATTRNTNGFGNSMVDFAGPLTININTFPRITLNKYQDEDEDFSTKTDWTAKNWNLSLYKDTVNANNLKATVSSASQLGTFDTLVQGTYIAVESDSSGWTHLGFAHDSSNGVNSLRYITSSSNRDTFVVKKGDTMTVKMVSTKNRTATTTTLSSGTNPVGLGNSVTFTANVSPVAASGTVQFYDSTTSTVLGTPTLTGGSTTLSTSSLTIGNHRIGAYYNGDNSYRVSASNAVVETVKYVLTVTAPTNGSITPSGTTLVSSGGSQQFTITPNTNYQIDSVFDNGVYVGNSSTYTVSNVSANHTITASFKIVTPTTTSINPSSKNVGDAQFTMTVNGTNFINGVSVVRFNGSDRTTTFVSSTQLTVTIPASDLLTAGTYNITVFNSGGGGTSNAQTFTVNNLTPTTTSISPSSKYVGDGQFTMTVNGTNFISSSVVRFGGSDRTTTFVSSTQLTATIPASDLTSVGTANITVFNPTPGGGTSNAQTFTILITTYSITVTQPANGSISPSDTTVTSGDNVQFTFTPNATYHLDSIFVDGVYVGNTSPYTLVNVTGNRTVTAKFSNQFSITITDPPNGDISPSGNQTVTYGDSMQFFVTPDVGYEIDSIFVNGVYYGNTSPFTVYNITSNLTITVKFRLKTYSIAVTQPANGSISPTGPVSVSHGSNVQFTFTPNATYHIDSIFVDGVYVGNTSPYTITNVTSNRSVSAKYSNQFSITITDPPNGDISPSGNQTVTYGDSMQFFVTPDVGYEIDSIFVNGVYYGNTSPFTVYNITSNLTITVKFRLKTYSITVTQPANGSISPSSTVVNHGDSLQLTFTPNATYHIDSIFVDGNYVGNSSTYTLQNITGAHTVTAKYSNQFSVTVNEPTNGDISPSGNVDVTYGDSLQFFVTPDEGYEIDSIFVNGAYYGNTSPFTVYNVTSDLTINVTFRLKSYTISVTQPANGSISPAGAVSVTHGSNKQFQFFPDATYHIDSILVDGSYVGNTTPYVVQNVTSNHTVTAVYSNQFSVTVNEPTNGDISPSGNLDVTYGDSLQFFVTPDEGYEIDSIFVNDVYNGNTSPFTVYNITSNLNVRVKFKLKTYSISVTQPQNGGISPTGPVSVTHGGSVLFTFTPNTGYALDSIFVNGAYVGNSSTYNLQNINGNKTVTAKYKKLTYQVSIATPQNGNISPSGNLTVEYGDSIQFSITPNTGYEIDSIFVNGVYVGNSSTYVLRNITGTSSVAVKFRIKTYAVTVTTPTNGTISPSGTLSVTHGDSRVFTITPNTGYHIDSIFVDGVYVGNTSPYTLSNITGNRTLFVKFKLNTYTITVLSTTNGGITPTGPITANYGSNQQFTISPNTGYHIDSVFVDGSYVGNTSPYTITNVISNRTISAKFAINQYTITVATPTNGTISPTGPVTTNYGTSQTFTITPNTGYHIVNVTINGEVNLGAVTQHTFTNIASNYSLAATFEINGYVIVASAGTNGSIAPSGNVNVNYGSDQNFTITSNEGYHIDSVFVDGEYIGDDAEYEFSALDTNHTISVLFAINQYTLTINVDSTGSVQISPEQELYDHGTTVTLTGVPARAFFFDSWNGDAIDTTNPLSITMDRDKTVQALFVLDPAYLQEFRTISQADSLGKKATKMKIKKKKPLPIPNFGDVRNEILYKPNLIRQNEGVGLFTVGVRFTQKDSAKRYGYLVWKTGNDIRKFFTSNHDGKSYPLDSIRTAGKKSKRMTRGLAGSRKKYNNPLAAEQAILKMNIGGSVAGVLPSGFGNIVYYESGGDPRLERFKGLTLKQIANQVDTIMTLHTRYGLGRVDTTDVYDSLAALLAKLNRSFDTPVLDSFDMLLKVINVKQGRKIAVARPRAAWRLFDVPYLLKGVNDTSARAWTNDEYLTAEPVQFVLEQNYPNPFNPATIIEFSLSTVAKVNLKVYNILGQEVATIVNNEILEDGAYQYSFDARHLSSGVYFYRWKAENVSDDGRGEVFVKEKKMMLIK